MVVYCVIAFARSSSGSVLCNCSYKGRQWYCLVLE